MSWVLLWLRWVEDRIGSSLLQQLSEALFILVNVFNMFFYPFVVLSFFFSLIISLRFLSTVNKPAHSPPQKKRKKERHFSCLIWVDILSEVRFGMSLSHRVKASSHSPRLCKKPTVLSLTLQFLQRHVIWTKLHSTIHPPQRCPHFLPTISLYFMINHLPYICPYLSTAFPRAPQNTTSIFFFCTLFSHCSCQMWTANCPFHLHLSVQISIQMIIKPCFCLNRCFV